MFEFKLKTKSSLTFGINGKSQASVHLIFIWEVCDFISIELSFNNSMWTISSLKREI